MRDVARSADCPSNSGERETVSADLMPMTNRNSIHNCLAGIAAGYDETARFFSDVFARLESLWSELVERENQLTRRQSAWRSERDESHARLRAQSVELERERALLAHDREQARLRAEEGEGDPNGCSESNGPAEEIRRLEREQAASAQQRAVLERELELVRGRSAEMAEELIEQARQIAEERALWNDELKGIRRLLEAMAQQRPETSAPCQAPVSQPPADTRSVAPPLEPVPGDDDPVLDSVMAQFEVLQKDLSRWKKNDLTLRGAVN